jgi:hypothetical protein
MAVTTRCDEREASSAAPAWRKILIFAKYSEIVFVAAMSSSPKSAGGDTGATAEAVTVLWEPHQLLSREEVCS